VASVKSGWLHFPIRRTTVPVIPAAILCATVPVLSSRSGGDAAEPGPGASVSAASTSSSLMRHSGSSGSFVQVVAMSGLRLRT